MRLKDVLIYVLSYLLLVGFLLYQITQIANRRINTPTSIIIEQIVPSEGGLWQCKTNPSISKKEAEELYIIAAEIISRYKEDHTYNQGCTSAITPYLMVNLMKIESNFNPKCAGKSGEIGLTQIIPKYHEKSLKSAGVIKDTEELWDTHKNIEAGVYILMHNARNSSSIEEALSRYNTGKVCDKGLAYSERVLAYRKGDGHNE